MSTLRGYPAYMDASARWLTQLPVGWDLTRVRYICDVTTGSGDTVDADPEGSYPFYVRSQQALASTGYTFDDEAVLTAGDGAVGEVFHHVTGKFHAHQRVYVLHGFRGVEPRFFFYYFSALFRLMCNDGSARTTVDSVRRWMVTDMPVALPSHAEQLAITDFLDEQTSRIDTLIGKQTQLVDTLRERRQALLLRAVTKGLDSTTTLRPSGLGWAGEIPANWDVANIRRYASMKTGHTPSRSTPEYWTDCHIPWVTLADVWQLRDGRATYLQEGTQTRISNLGLANSAAELLPAGTVVLSRTASVGFSGIMPVPMATSQDYWNWVCGPSLLPTFLLATFRAMRDEFRSLMIGSTHQTIYQPIAAAISVVVPPIDEQREIVAYIDRQTSQIDALIAKAEELIGLARERRAALITAAVTGQIDVRTAGRAATVDA